MQDQKYDKYLNEGLSYFSGEEKGFPLNYMKAEELFLKSADENNNRLAYYQLGKLYEKLATEIFLHETENDHNHWNWNVKAIKAFETAARLGHGYSQYKIGDYWTDVNNFKNAYRWYLLSLSNGINLHCRIADLEKKLKGDDILWCQANAEKVKTDCDLSKRYD